jgi:enterochelin esterase-like enzyme
LAAPFPVIGKPMKKFMLYLTALSSLVLGCQHEDSPSRIERVDSFESEYVDARIVDIYLPAGYDDSKRKYPVLYMHDGQNIFTPETSYGGISWEVDSVLESLVSQGRIQPAIIVGVWNNGVKRGCEYQPKDPFVSDTLLMDTLHQSFRCSEIISNDYLQFLVEEVKPYVDDTYRTLDSKENTFIAGSSMGGIISLYAITKYPEVFGAAACISTHWLGTTNYNESLQEERFDLLTTYFEKNLSPNTGSRIYFDYGDQTLDSLYEPFQQRMDGIMERNGFNKTQWKTQKFPGHAHHEASWKERFHIPLTFLLASKTE